MATAKRTVLLVLFVLAAMIVGLALGTAIAGVYLVPAGSGLAGPAIALGYGVLGAIIALVAALVAIKIVPAPWQAWAAIPVLVAGLVIAVLIGRTMVASRAASDVFLQEAYENMNVFDVTLRYEADQVDAPFRELRLDWSTRTLTISYVDDPSRRCSAAVAPAQAVTMLTALRGVEGLLYGDELPCKASLGDPERNIQFSIIEKMPPNNSGEVAITAACAAEHPALLGPFETAAAILESGEVALPCRE